MRVDSSYDFFFYSLGMAVITCTLVVSVGKSITDYYFVCIVICSLVVIISLTFYGYYRYNAALPGMNEVFSVEKKLKNKSLLNSVLGILLFQEYNTISEKHQLPNSPWMNKDGRHIILKSLDSTCIYASSINTLTSRRTLQDIHSHKETQLWINVLWCLKCRIMRTNVKLWYQNRNLFFFW